MGGTNMGDPSARLRPDAVGGLLQPEAAQSSPVMINKTPGADVAALVSMEFIFA